MLYYSKSFEPLLIVIMKHRNPNLMFCNASDHFSHQLTISHHFLIAHQFGRFNCRRDSFVIFKDLKLFLEFATAHNHFKMICFSKFLVQTKNCWQTSNHY